MTRTSMKNTVNPRLFPMSITRGQFLLDHCTVTMKKNTISSRIITTTICSQEYITTNHMAGIIINTNNRGAATGGAIIVMPWPDLSHL